MVCVNPVKLLSVNIIKKTVIVPAGRPMYFLRSVVPRIYYLEQKVPAIEQLYERFQQMSTAWESAFPSFI